MDTIGCCPWLLPFLHVLAVAVAAVAVFRLWMFDGYRHRVVALKCDAMQYNKQQLAAVHRSVEQRLNEPHKHQYRILGRIYSLIMLQFASEWTTFCSAIENMQIGKMFDKNKYNLQSEEERANKDTREREKKYLYYRNNCSYCISSKLVLYSWLFEE